VSKLIVTSAKKKGSVKPRVKEHTPEDHDVIFDFILTKILMMIILILASLKRMKLLKISPKIILFLIDQKMTKKIFNFICCYLKFTFFFCLTGFSNDFFLNIIFNKNQRMKNKIMTNMLMIL